MEENVELGTHYDISMHEKEMEPFDITTKLVKKLIHNKKPVLIRTSNSGKISVLDADNLRFLIKQLALELKYKQEDNN